MTPLTLSTEASVCAQDSWVSSWRRRTSYILRMYRACPRQQGYRGFFIAAPSMTVRRAVRVAVWFPMEGGGSKYLPKNQFAVSSK